MQKSPGQFITYIALAGAAGWILIILLLHILEPQFDPSWHMLSEYELGNYGWMMQIAFFCMGISCIATLIATWFSARTIAGRLGLILLASIGFIGSGAGVFITDPITSTITTHSGELHTVCGMTFIIGFPITVTLIWWSLTRKESPTQVLLSLATVLVWIGFLSFVLSLVIFAQHGLGPSAPIGWGNRLMAISYGIWLITLAWIKKPYNKNRLK